MRHLPDLLRLRREVRRFLRERDIDLLVPIDYPGFNLPLARFARASNIRVLYYIAPQVWAWGEGGAWQLGDGRARRLTAEPVRAAAASGSFVALSDGTRTWIARSGAESVAVEPDLDSVLPFLFSEE